MNNYWFLENVDLFKILCPHKYGNFKETHTFNHYKKSDYIYFEEDAASKVFLIDKGKVKIGYYTNEGDEVIKAILSKGELFGEKAILGEEKRNEFAQSIDNSTIICPVGVGTLHELMRDNQTFTLKIYKFIRFRIRKLERRLQLLMFKDSKTRLIEFLDDLQKDYGSICDKTGFIKANHPYTQKDIACLIGTSRPTLNIIMNELKEAGKIDFKGKEILFLNKIG